MALGGMTHSAETGRGVFAGPKAAEEYAVTSTGGCHDSGTTLPFSSINEK